MTERQFARQDIPALLAEIERLKADAARYQWLKRHLEFELGSYNSASGWLPEATSSDWYLRSPSLFKSVNSKPANVDAAIDAAAGEEGRTDD